MSRTPPDVQNAIVNIQPNTKLAPLASSAASCKSSSDSTAHTIISTISGQVDLIVNMQDKTMLSFGGL